MSFQSSYRDVCAHVCVCITKTKIYFFDCEFLGVFKKILFICFNWRTITSQHYGVPCHTSTWISYGHTGALPSWTPLPPPSPPHPSGLFQSASFECPASCIELALVVYFTYGNIHDSMLFSHIIPPLPSPTESSILFFISVSLFCCLAYKIIIIIFLNSIYML